MDKDLYLILGISPKARTEEIKKAYRRLVKKHHPDCSKSTPDKFHLITEAYRVLTDPCARKEYDNKRKVGGSKPSGSFVNYNCFDKIFGNDSEGFGFSSPKSPADAFGGFEKMFNSFFGAATGRRSPNNDSADTENIYVEVILSPEEADQGVKVPVDIPFEQNCPTCQGSGYQSMSYCPTCGGGGIQLKYKSFSVKLPAGIKHGRRMRFSLEKKGLLGHILNIIVTIE